MTVAVRWLGLNALVQQECASFATHCQTSAGPRSASRPSPKLVLALDHTQGRGHIASADDGRYWFWSVLPEAYPIPHDGPVGDLLKAAGRHPWRPAHIHFQISTPGFKPCTTHVFVDGDEYLDSDPVFGVKQSLIQGFQHHDSGTPTPDGRDLGGGEWWEMHHDFVLAPEDAG